MALSAAQHRVEPTPTLALFTDTLCPRWCWQFRWVMPTGAGGRGSHQPLGSLFGIQVARKTRGSG